MLGTFYHLTSGIIVKTEECDLLVSMTISSDSCTSSSSADCSPLNTGRGRGLMSADNPELPTSVVSGEGPSLFGARFLNGMKLGGEAQGERIKCSEPHSATTFYTMSSNTRLVKRDYLRSPGHRHPL